MAFSVECVDVTICGGGPTGLLTAYGLLKGGISSCVVERDIKTEMPDYGRACSIFPRSLEIFDSYEVLDDMLQIGFIDRTAFVHIGMDEAYMHNVQLPKSGMGGTHFDFVLNLRQKSIESIIQETYERGGGTMAVGWQLTDIAIDPNQAPHIVITRMKNLRTGDFRILKSKYLIGADGIRSIARAFAGIRMPWSSTVLNWIRVDGVVETDLPDVDLGTTIVQSSSHGAVQVTRLDRGRTRIGYSFAPDLVRRYGQFMTQEQAMFEAQQAILPWSYDFKDVDWYTCYSVRYAIADSFIKGPIILVGDAAHIHPSGSSQGLNAGIHDAANLAWKLSGIVKGQFDPALLETYNSERRSTAISMIDFQRQLSDPHPVTAMVGYGATDMSIVDTMQKISHETSLCSIGLDNIYPATILTKPPSATMLIAGTRAPDGLLYRPGSKLPVRIQQIIRDDGKFSIMVFAGEPLYTKQNVMSLRDYFDHNPRSVIKLYPQTCKLLSIMTGNRSEGEVELGCFRFGDLWYDHDVTVHHKYSVSPKAGAVVVVRPDGIIAYATALDRGEELGDYFEHFMIRKS